MKEEYTFDARVLELLESDLYDMMYFRYKDAVKNGVSAIHHSLYGNSHKVNTIEKLNKLGDRYFTHYSDHIRFGTFITREKKLKEFSPRELSNIPPRYRPVGPVFRTVFDRTHTDKGLNDAQFRDFLRDLLRQSN